MDNLNTCLSINQALPLSDNHNSLKAGPRRSTLLENCILREKLAHFDHGYADGVSDLFTAAFVSGLAQHRRWERT